MDLTKVLNYIRREFPEQAVDLNECIELILETLDNTVDKIQHRISSEVANRNFEAVSDHVSKAKEISDLENRIVEIRNELEPEFEEVTFEDKDEEAKQPNYDAYLVDTDIPHSLYENLAHKRPWAYEFMQDKTECRTWIEVLTSFCEKLAEKDMSLLLQFESDPKMNGKKANYFSSKQEGLRKPHLIKGTSMYIETNMSANSIRNLIIKMLQRYGYKSTDFTIFLRADYTDLHKD